MWTTSTKSIVWKLGKPPLFILWFEWIFDLKQETLLRMEPIYFSFLRFVIQYMNIVIYCLADMKNIPGFKWLF